MSRARSQKRFLLFTKKFQMHNVPKIWNLFFTACKILLGVVIDGIGKLIMIWYNAEDSFSQTNTFVNFYILNSFIFVVFPPTHLHCVTTMYVLDVLWDRQIKLIQVASNSKLRENQWNDLLFFEIVPSHCFGASEASKIDCLKNWIWKFWCLNISRN